MIIGSGLLAQAFAPQFAGQNDFIVFASGVSNSRETRQAAFDREAALLETSLATGRPLAYFSTCSIDDPELSHSPYVLHKLAMEARVLQQVGRAGRVFRLPQVVGHTPNPHTLTNYLHHQIATGSPFQLWKKARRNLIDVSDVAAIVIALLASAPVSDGVASNTPADRICNVACPFSTPVSELVALFEQVVGKPAVYTEVDAGGSYQIDCRTMLTVVQDLGITFDAAYIPNLIKKYYA